MAISVLLLIICAIVLLFLLPHSKYGLPLFFMISGIILTTISVLFQYYSSSSYVPPAYLPFRSFDIYLYRTIGRNISISMRQMQMVRNAGVVTYLLGIAFLLDSIQRNIMSGTGVSALTRHLRSKCILALLCISYLLFYSTSAAYHIYLRYCALGSAGGRHLVLLIGCVHLLFHLAIFAYLFYPLLYLAINVRKKRVTCFTGTIVIIMISVSSINLCYYGFVFLSIFRNAPAHVFASGFWFFNRITRIPPFYISIYPIFALAVLIFITLSINSFFALDMLSYSKNRLLKKQIDDLNYNLKDVFHSEKNMMFSISILANEALSSYGTPEGKEKLSRIIDISNEQMQALNNSLNAIKQLHIKPGAVDLKDLTEKALQQAQIPDAVQIERSYTPLPVLCTLDPYHTLNALTNLIINALDSLSMQAGEMKILRVTIDASDEWAYWSLWDNGVGIESESVKKMMMPFASTKSKQSNWGIGLPYAFRVITTQLGQMRMTGSTEEKDHHAQVEILLPRRKERSGVRK